MNFCRLLLVVGSLAVGGGAWAQALVEFRGIIRGYVDENTVRGDSTPLGAVWYGSYSYRAAKVDGFFTAVPYVEDPEGGGNVLNPQRLYFSIPPVPGWGPVDQDSFDPELTWLRVLDGGRTLSFFTGAGGNTQVEFRVTENSGYWLFLTPDDPPFGRSSGRLEFGLPVAVPESRGMLVSAGLLFLMLRRWSWARSRSVGVKPKRRLISMARPLVGSPGPRRPAKGMG